MAQTTTDLLPTIQTGYEPEDDAELAEAIDMCTRVGIPAEYAPNLAAAIAICTEAGA